MWKGKRTGWNHSQSFALGAFVATSIALIVMVYNLQVRMPRKLADHVYSYRGSDFPQKWNIPPLEPAQITMENTVHFALNTPLSILEWNSTLPSGNGMLYLGDELEPYSISLFHQLRCLNVIRDGLVKFKNDGRRTKPDALVHHCTNYLRQMVLCRSDLRLEHARHLMRGIAVSDITHGTCKDWTAVYEEAEKNYKMYQRAKTNGIQ